MIKCVVDPLNNASNKMLESFFKNPPEIIELKNDLGFYYKYQEKLHKKDFESCK